MALPPFAVPTFPYTAVEGIKLLRCLPSCVRSLVRSSNAVPLRRRFSSCHVTRAPDRPKRSRRGCATNNLLAAHLRSFRGSKRREEYVGESEECGSVSAVLLPSPSMSTAEKSPLFRREREREQANSNTCHASRRKERRKRQLPRDIAHVCITQEVTVLPTPFTSNRNCLLVIAAAAVRNAAYRSDSDSGQRAACTMQCSRVSTNTRTPRSTQRNTQSVTVPLRHCEQILHTCVSERERLYVCGRKGGRLADANGQSCREKLDQGPPLAPHPLSLSLSLSLAIYISGASRHT